MSCPFDGACLRGGHHYQYLGLLKVSLNHLITTDCTKFNEWFGAEHVALPYKSLSLLGAGLLGKLVTMHTMETEEMNIA